MRRAGCDASENAMGMTPEAYTQLVAIDDCHIELLAALVKAHKSRTLLELGYGSGRSAAALARAVAANAVAVRYDIVDSWADNQGRPWAEPGSLSPHVRFHAATEEAFVAACSDRYDFILSDADHAGSHKWFGRVYSRLLEEGGILACHDVLQPDFPNLFGIYKACLKYQIPHMLFHRSTLAEERCQRGLLVVFKTPGLAPVEIPDDAAAI